MLWPATVIGATAGLALASIPGALLGALLGQVVDRRLRLDSWSALFGHLRGSLASDAPPDDEQLLFVLLGRLAKSDGPVLETHIQMARGEMRRLQLDDSGQRKAIEAFSRGKLGQHSLRQPLSRLRARPERGEVLLRACWRMIWADGRVGPRERDSLLQWGQWLGWRSEAVLALGQDYQPAGRAMPTHGGSYQEALRLLGVKDDSEPAAIKRAYRRLLSRHHPDKLAGSGATQARVREATDKTRELHNAFSLIRERRGFR
ncbi:TerB family tellurite resistance protein [Pseudomonas sp. LS44]|uniref:TerB family tellurite resistance protein n=1 Tax=Pseudomonas sp. LS44 TaxID=1357074 RepID=UPI00215A502C|nr:TerB family tellurite resistance protein [Pseudomonas sp. LS44]UVE19800.1 TerB family tellurite resistance protein [Pseudomonas sp. LS44]